MGYILTPGVNGVNGVKEEQGRGMEGIWGKSPARGKRAATPGAAKVPAGACHEAKNVIANPGRKIELLPFTERTEAK